MAGRTTTLMANALIFSIYFILSNYPQLVLLLPLALLWAALPNDGVAFVADWFIQKVGVHKRSLKLGLPLGRRSLLTSLSYPTPELRRQKLTR